MVNGQCSMEKIAQRLDALREEMRREHLSAFIFPSTDPHNSEYTADHWKGREWISGFNGSAGTAVVTLHAAALWTDSRYFIAAAQQLEGTEYQLMRERVEGTPTIAEWLGKQLADERDKMVNGQWSMVNGQCSEVGLYGMDSTANAVQQLTSELRQHGGLTLRTNFDPLQRIWTNRPPIPMRPIVPQPIEYAGEDTALQAVTHPKSLARATCRRHAHGFVGRYRLDAEPAW